MKLLYAKIFFIVLHFILPPICFSQQQTAPESCVPLPKNIHVDQVWGGVKVAFSAVESPSNIYIAYYDKDRWLTLSEINKCTGRISKVRLPSRFLGWDPHNYITMALDSEYRLHVSGNMHVSPLVYARMLNPGDFQSLQVLQAQVGKEEKKVTYPLFFKFPDGALGFSYRYGKSGNGIEIINRFDGLQWKRWMNTPLFAPADGKHVNAYHTGYQMGLDGNFHVAWVWRENSNVETNFNVNYARSPDLKHWYNSRGEALVLPITPNNAEVAQQVPQMSGLLNNIRLGFDNKMQPIISYLRFDDSGATQLWHVRNEDGIWKNYQSTHWDYRWDPRGGGSIPQIINFGGVEWRDGTLMERVSHKEIGNTTLQYENDTLQVQKTIQNYKWDTSPKIKRQNPPGTIVSVLPVKDGKGSIVNGRAISWVSMPVDANRGLERPCRPEIADCRYVFDLELHSAD